MRKFADNWRNFLDDESGATAIEYGLIAGLMAVGAILAFAQMGNGLVNLFGSTADGAGGIVHNAANSVNSN